MPKGDFEISLNYAEDDREYPENNLNIIQLQNPLNDDLKTQIMSLDGVEGIDESTQFWQTLKMWNWKHRE